MYYNKSQSIRKGIAVIFKAGSFMDTIKIKKSNVKFIAHRGLSGIETENSAAAFVAAANRSYYGIETDVHVTADGKYIIIHDDNTARVCGEGIDYSVEQTDFDTLRSLRLIDISGFCNRADLVLPTPEEYFSICKKYGKIAVFELKDDMAKEHIAALVRLINDINMLENTVFISFSLQNLISLRELCENARAQYLLGDIPPIDVLCGILKRYSLSLDAYHGSLTAEIVSAVHGIGGEVNAWTVNDADSANRLIDMGVDYITTNILEGV